MLFTRIFYGLFLLSLTAFVYASDASFTEVERAFIKSHPTITIGAGESFEPYVIPDDEGTVTGFDVDIVSEVGRITGLEFLFELDRWEDIQQKAINREVDGISAAIPNDVRLQYLTPTSSYITSTTVIFVQKGNPQGINSLNNLAGKQVALQAGNALLKGAIKSVSDTLNIIYTDSIHGQISRLIAGEVDFIVLDETAPYLANKMGLGGFIEPAFTIDSPYKLHFLFRNDWPELTTLFNKALASIPPQDMQAMRNRWFESIQPKTDFGPILRVGLLSLLILACLSYWTLMIRKSQLRAKRLLAEIKAKDKALLAANKALSKQANTDHLTGLYNRVNLDSELTLAMEKANRYQQSFAVILLDIDHFKSINDKFGHLAGDQVLIEAAALMQANCRTVDVLGRWGGEEFLIISFSQGYNDLHNHGNKLREELAKHVFQEVGHVTASFGIARYRFNENRRSFINRADAALYRAKQQGRNCIVYSAE